MIRLKHGAHLVEGVVNGICESEQRIFALVDGAAVEHRAPVEHFVPILPSVNQDQIMLRQFAGLHQREHFPKLVHGAESARENDQGFRDLREPQFAHEKIMEVEAQFAADEAIGKLFVRQLDAQADGFSAGFGCAAIRCFHDAGAAAAADDEAARVLAERHGPGSDAAREFARLFVIVRHVQRVARGAQAVE